MSFKTEIASMASYDKGIIELNDDLHHYAFSNIYEVAKKSAAFERVMLASNLEYCLEVIKVEGTSPWYTAPHDEFAIIMEGEIEFSFYKLEDDEKPTHEGGAIKLSADPKGQRMGLIRARLGHQVLLPEGSAYQLKADKPSVAIVQTTAGPESIERWSENCILD